MIAHSIRNTFKSLVLGLLFLLIFCQVCRVNGLRYSCHTLQHTSNKAPQSAVLSKRWCGTPRSSRRFSAESGNCNGSVETDDQSQVAKLGEPGRYTFRYEEDGGEKRVVRWDESQQRFQRTAPPQTKYVNSVLVKSSSFFVRNFFPDNVTDDYYRYTAWRSLHRFMSSTLNVFGTQALLLALGIKTKLGTAAAANWVLKDTLGTVFRIFWAGKMGRRFDADAKKWRYRTSLLYTLGTGLEVVTYAFPSLFLVFATLSNALKQTSRLTFSATRNTFYRSFAQRGENIGDITAKGEAQISLVDLLGMCAGIAASKAIGTSKAKLALAYLGCSAVELFAIYREIRAVVFGTLNHERTLLAAERFLQGGCAPAAAPTPEALAAAEPIFLPSRFRAKRNFATVTETGLADAALQRCLGRFRGERFALARRAREDPEGLRPTVLLHADAGNEDVLKALFALSAAQQARAAGAPSFEAACEAAAAAAREHFPAFAAGLWARGWNEKFFLYKDIKKRTSWVVLGGDEGEGGGGGPWPEAADSAQNGV